MYLFDLPNVFVWIETCICPIVTLVWSLLTCSHDFLHQGQYHIIAFVWIVFGLPIQPNDWEQQCTVWQIPQQAPGRGHVWSRSVNMSARCQHKYGLIVQHWIDHYWCVTLLQLLLHSDVAAQIWSYSPRPDWSQLIAGCYTVIILYSIIFMFLCWSWMFKCHHSVIKMFNKNHIVVLK